MVRRVDVPETPVAITEGKILQGAQRPLTVEDRALRIKESQTSACLSEAMMEEACGQVLDLLQVLLLICNRVFSIMRVGFILAFEVPNRTKRWGSLSRRDFSRASCRLQMYPQLS